MKKTSYPMTSRMFLFLQDIAGPRAFCPLRVCWVQFPDPGCEPCNWKIPLLKQYGKPCSLPKAAVFEPFLQTCSTLKKMYFRKSLD